MILLLVSCIFLFHSLYSYCVDQKLRFIDFHCRETMFFFRKKTDLYFTTHSFNFPILFLTFGWYCNSWYFWTYFWFNYLFSLKFSRLQQATRKIRLLRGKCCNQLNKLPGRHDALGNKSNEVFKWGEVTQRDMICEAWVNEHLGVRRFSSCAVRSTNQPDLINSLSWKVGLMIQLSLLSVIISLPCLTDQCNLIY